MPNIREAGLLAMTRQALVLGMLLALVPPPSAAQADRFRAIDRNGDRSISSEEWYGQSVAPVPFTVIDLDGDGRISETEFRDWSTTRGGASVTGVTAADRFRATDKNKDGVISGEEWKDGWLSATPFASVDANKDGTISSREFSAWDQRRGRPEVAAPGPPPGIGARPAGIAAPAGVQPTPPAASSRTPAPVSPFATTPSTGTAPGVSSPNMRSGSSLTTK